MKRSNVVRTLSRPFCRWDVAIVEDRGGCEKSALGAECEEEPEERGEGAVRVNGRILSCVYPRGTCPYPLRRCRRRFDSKNTDQTYTHTSPLELWMPKSPNREPCFDDAIFDEGLPLLQGLRLYGFNTHSP